MNKQVMVGIEFLRLGSYSDCFDGLSVAYVLKEDRRAATSLFFSDSGIAI
jgi:hypothetical protein